MTNTATLLGLVAIALAAFTTEGAIGFGGTVLIASLGAQLIPLDQLLPAFVPINLALSAWLVVRGWRAIAWRLLATEIAPAVAVGAVIGLALFHLPAKTALALAFGGFVAALATLQLVRPAQGSLAQPWRALMLVAGGIAHGLFGTGGPMIVYVARRRVADKRAFRATLSLLWLALNLALVANFAALDLYAGRETLVLGAALAVVVVPGLWLGQKLHDALDPVRFERAVWCVLWLAGSALAVRSAIALLR